MIIIPDTPLRNRYTSNSSALHAIIHSVRKSPIILALGIVDGIGILLCTTLLLLFHINSSQISVSNAEYSIEGATPVSFEMPLVIPGNGEHIAIDFDAHFAFSYPQTFRIIPDDCIEKMVINGMGVASERIPFCPPHATGEVYDLGPYIQAGTNHIHVVIRDIVGNAALEIIPAYPMRLFLSILQTLLYVLAVLIAITIPWKDAPKARGKTGMRKKR